MKFKEVSKEEMNNIAYRQEKSIWTKTLEEFLASDLQMAEVEWTADDLGPHRKYDQEWRDADYVVSKLRGVIFFKDAFKGKVKIAKRGDRVFLVRVTR